MAAAIEGPNVGLFGRSFVLGQSADFWLIEVSIPLFLLLSLIAYGKFDSKLIGTLMVGFFLGIIIEDFVWYLINPYFGIQKFNVRCDLYPPCADIIGFHIPYWYFNYIISAILSWFVFIRNRKMINTFYSMLKKQLKR
jgi:hypothetical protein